MSYLWINPEYRSLAQSRQWSDLDELLSHVQGQLVRPTHHARETLRLELPGADGACSTFYLKREPRVPWKYVLRRAAFSGRWWTPARNELEMLLRLRAAGLAGPEVVVCCQRLWPRPACALITKALEGYQPLNQLLAREGRRLAVPQLARLFAALGDQLARMHEAGVFHPRLFSDHVYVRPEDQGWQLAFLGFRRAWACNHLGLQARARSLAAMLATLSPRVADARMRQHLIDAYLGCCGWEDRSVELLAEVARSTAELLAQRQVWEIRETDTQAHQGLHPLESLQAGRMWVDPEFRPLLEALGLASFEAVMETTSGKRLRALADRENWRLELPRPDGTTVGAYLKKHRSRSWRNRHRARRGLPPAEPSPGRVEARNTVRLSRSGIDCMRLIAYGEKLHRDGLLESFVLTEELEGFTQLDHFLRQRFPERRPGPKTEDDRHLDALIAQVAAVARKFHRLGYNHRDLYCCHFFIREDAPGRYTIHLIDLQRVQHRRHFRTRWLVKDLAQLAYSAPAERIGRTHRMAFIKHYLQVEKLRPEHKRFIRRVLAKWRWMERTLGKHP